MKTRPPTLEELVVSTRPAASRHPAIDLTHYAVAPEIIALVPRALCDEHVVLPVSRAGRFLILAVVAPDSTSIDAIAEHTGMNVDVVIAPADEIRAAIQKYHGGQDPTESPPESHE